MAQTLFLGDMEGQFTVFRRSILPVLKSDSRLISLGNLIACDNDAKDRKDSGRNAAILTMWDKAEYPKIKLIGPNEILALNFPDRWTNHTSNTFLRDGWLSSSKSYLSAIELDGRLITHGGLTYGEWLTIGKPMSAFDAAEALNRRYANTLYQGECFRLTGKINPAANAIWADGITELYPSWFYAPIGCPFDQIVGGESLNNDRASQLKNNLDHPLAHLDHLEFTNYGSYARVKNASITCIDYNLGLEMIAKFRQDRTLYAEELDMSHPVVKLTP